MRAAWARAAEAGVRRWEAGSVLKVVLTGACRTG